MMASELERVRVEERIGNLRKRAPYNMKTIDLGDGETMCVPDYDSPNYENWAKTVVLVDQFGRELRNGE